mmetsp:Transcript_33089/g.67536  ORF Transcript_33089/g.67536 Transcript_33089/m.67536 type:complete len:81 (+) Transcript_33089:198-440(+)|eukprot:CAMPEP_0183291326 /NCGR_PEP_ID=MMETSP0160_2-20130417/787_1 /TAXON_ID=2839 ORGANISM="Odontella Sinensis, Strain Grunow 1884" /NCGR_SAMPLE_ID=MMETSP0160_2 /ASSEMBLY_ACC=CAM_ASM_000250 /LENGTH=80 /DNA_ID=CAMNT_0025452123 /DNA_START=197 /DNA_END=439 /DNA_ORIENTATION=+
MSKGLQDTANENERPTSLRSARGCNINSFATINTSPEINSATRQQRTRRLVQILEQALELSQRVDISHTSNDPDGKESMK